jgi:hypothetical protein
VCAVVIVIREVIHSFRYNYSVKISFQETAGGDGIDKEHKSV